MLFKWLIRMDIVGVQPVKEASLVITVDHNKKQDSPPDRKSVV